MRPRSVWLRLLIVTLGLLAVVVIGFIVIGVIVFYPKYAKLRTDYLNIQPGASLSGTNYMFEEDSGMIFLKNNSTQKTVDITDSDMYKLLDHGSQIYLILGSREMAGTAGAMDFDVYNITTDQPQHPTSDYMPLGYERSCTLPLLYGDELEFIIADHCDQDEYIVVPHETPHTYAILLK